MSDKYVYIYVYIYIYTIIYVIIRRNAHHLPRSLHGVGWGGVE